MRKELIDKIEKLIGVPKECIYPSKATEPHDRHLNVDGINIYYNDRYGYVDVVGLEMDEFEELVSRYPSIYLEEDPQIQAEGEEYYVDPEIERQYNEAEEMSNETWIEELAYSDYERQCMEGYE